MKQKTPTGKIVNDLLMSLRRVHGGKRLVHALRSVAPVAKRWQTATESALVYAGGATLILGMMLLTVTEIILRTATSPSPLVLQA